MVLRLDPAIPVVWRDPRTLQFGVDPAVAVLEHMTRGQERLVAALTTGVTSSGFRMLAAENGVATAQREELLARLAPCLSSADRAAATPAAAVVLGSGGIARELARLLTDAGLRQADATGTPALAVLVAERVLAPADHRAWLQRDIPHLPVVIGDASVTVGPLVVPGLSACLHCAFLHERDADAAWPAIAAQLGTLPPPAPHPLRSAAAVAHTARVVAGFLDGRGEPGLVWRVAGDGDRISARSVIPHPECRCATPPGSDWAPADETAGPRPTSAARASAARG